MQHLRENITDRKTTGPHIIYTNNQKPKPQLSIDTIQDGGETKDIIILDGLPLIVTACYWLQWSFTDCYVLLQIVTSSQRLLLLLTIHVLLH